MPRSRRAPQSSDRTSTVEDSPEAFVFALDQLPLEVAGLIIEILPGDAKIRLAAVCKRFQTLLFESLPPRVHSCLCVSKESGATAEALKPGLRNLAALAKGQLTHLDVSGCHRIDKAVVTEIAFSNPDLRQILSTNIDGNWTATQVQHVLGSCRGLELFEVDLFTENLYEPPLYNLLHPTPESLVRWEEEAVKAKLAIAAAAAASAENEGEGQGAHAEHPTASLTDQMQSLTIAAPPGNDTVVEEESRDQAAEHNHLDPRLKAFRAPSVSVQGLGAPNTDVLEAAKYLTNEIIQRDVLRHLRLQHCGFGDTGVRHLAEALIAAPDRPPYLRHLDVSFNCVRALGAKHIADAFMEGNAGDVPTQVKTLHLNCNKIGAEGGLALAEVLREDLTGDLEELRLDCNDLKDDGVAHVMEAMADNTTLRRLELRGNVVKQGAGAACVADMLAKNETLEHLDLGCNELGDKGGIELSDGLWDNSTLRGLNVERNNLEDAAAAEFEQVMDQDEDECAITLLNLQSNNLTTACVARLAKNPRIDTSWQLAPKEKAPPESKAERRKRLAAERAKKEAEKSAGPSKRQLDARRWAKSGEL